MATIKVRQNRFRISSKATTSRWWTLIVAIQLLGMLSFVSFVASEASWCPLCVAERSEATLRHLLHRRQEIGVRLGLPHLVEQQLHRLDRRQRVEDLAQHPDAVEILASACSSSSLRVPLFRMSIAGKTRLSASLRSRWISMLPVPLNSSKITSSMREPVSMSAVAMIVSEPPSSMLRAAPKNRFGFCSALRVEAARQHLARRRDHGVVGARQARDRVEQDHHVLLVLDQALRLLDHHLGDLHVALRRLVEGRRDHLAVDRPLHVGHFFGPLVDEQHDQVDLGVIRRRPTARCSAAASSCRCAAARRSGRAGPCRSASSGP